MNTLDPKTVVLLGVPFHDVTMAETLAEIDEIVADRTPRYLATANLDFAAQASLDVELQRILLGAHLVLCDGTPLVWASHWLSAPLRERVAGSDLTPQLAARAAERGHRLFFLGSDETVLLTAKERLEAQYPGLQVCGVYSPPYAKLLDLDHEECARRIREAQPDILLVALGAPKQEKWIYMHYRSLGVPLCIGIGASLDFVAGKFSRAPVWMRRCGLEWTYRLMQEPKRLLHRYWLDFRFFVSALGAQRRHLRSPHQSAPEPVAPATATYRWTGRADAAAIAGGHLEEPLARAGCAKITLDLSAVTFMDSSGLGLLLKGFKSCREAGVEFSLAHPPKVVRDLLRLSKLDRLIGTETPGDGAPSTAPASQDRVVVHCSGELDAANADELRTLMRERWEAEAGARILEIDFTRVAFMDSSGLGCLIGARKLVAAREGSALKLTGVNDNLRNVISLARLDEFLGLAQAS